MPHILTTLHDDIALAKNVEGVDFHFIAKNRFEDKICVSVEDKTFLLTKQIKDKNNLIKLDSSTRVTPIYYAKQGLNSYAKLADAKILFKNTDNNENKLSPQKEYLKDISYFVDQFQTQKEICIEVGFGSGRHLLYQAQKNPNIIYIGLEIHTPSIEQMLKQVKILGITNILAVNYDARLFLEFMQSNSIKAIYVHFPVPWDKKPHRRVMSVEFIKESLRALSIGGTLELRTDSINYYEYNIELLKYFQTNKTTIIKNGSLEVSSKYEDRWKKQGKDIWDITIFANENSQNIDIDKNFAFNIDTNIDFTKFQNHLDTKPIVKDGYFVHFDKLYISNSLALLSLTMGSFTKPLSIYIKFENNTIEYFINKPIPTSANHKAHDMICDILKEMIV
jgi:tRNA (guanine-N7-)-methyltransferase